MATWANVPIPWNSGPRARTQLWVIHTIECPMEPGRAVSMTRWASTLTGGSRVSWHYTTGPDVIVRAVPKGLTAWHATIANAISVGVEQTAYANYSRTRWLQPDGRATITNTAHALIDSGIPLAACRRLTDDEVRRALNGDRGVQGLCAHAQIQPRDRTDPGAGYPWDLLVSELRRLHPASKPPPPKPPTPDPTLRGVPDVFLIQQQGLDPVYITDGIDRSRHIPSPAALKAVQGVLKAEGGSGEVRIVKDVRDFGVTPVTGGAK